MQKEELKAACRKALNELLKEATVKEMKEALDFIKNDRQKRRCQIN